MIKILIELVSDTKAYVKTAYWDTEQAGIPVEAISVATPPEPEIVSGKNPILCYNPQTEAVFYEYIDLTPNIEDSYASLLAEVTDLKAALILAQDENSDLLSRISDLELLYADLIFG